MTPEILAEAIRLDSVIKSLNATKSAIDASVDGQSGIAKLKIITSFFDTLLSIDDEQSAASFATLVDDLIANTTSTINSAISELQIDFDNLSTSPQP